MIDHDGTGENKRTTWKSINYIVDRSHFRALQSVWGSSAGAWAEYTVKMSRWGVETNLPWSELRAWFRSAGVPLRSDRIITSWKSLDELYADEDDNT